MTVMRQAKQPMIALAAAASVALAVVVGIVDARLVSVPTVRSGPLQSLPGGVAGPLAPLAWTLS